MGGLSRPVQLDGVAGPGGIGLWQQGQHSQQAVHGSAGGRTHLQLGGETRLLNRLHRQAIALRLPLAGQVQQVGQSSRQLHHVAAARVQHAPGALGVHVLHGNAESAHHEAIHHALPLAQLQQHLHSEADSPQLCQEPHAR